MTADRQTEAATVAVVIACYNQARFLAEAIESVLAQTRPADEVIVVDDGSSDETATVAGRYAEVTLLQQPNRGLAAARNRGWREARATFVVFLDADDRLLPEALAADLAHFARHPDCAFVAGHYRYVREDGGLLAEHAQQDIDSDVYGAFLRGNWVGMVATAMFRRSAIAAAGGFDERLPAGEDYDLFLRLSQQHAVSRFPEVTAEYRQHGQNMSANIGLMLPTILTILRKNAPPPSDPRRHEAFRAGLAAWKAHYCCIYLSPGARLRDATAILRHAPATMLSLVARHAWRQFRGAMRSSDGLGGRLWDSMQRPKIGRIRFGILSATAPQRPDPAASVEGHYLAAFLASVRHDLSACKNGVILYDSRFAAYLDKLAAPGEWRQVSIDFSSPDGEERLLTALRALTASNDGLVVLHGLSQVYDLADAIRCLGGALVPGGRLIVTVPGTVHGAHAEQDCYRRFSAAALKRLFGSEDWSAARLTSYGSVLSAMGALHGIPAREFAEKQLQAEDPSYPLMVGVTVRRSTGPAVATAFDRPAGSPA